MNKAIKNIVIVGGGSAGWLTAAIVAADRLVDNQSGITITLIESPKISPIGVGEGTWPSMRETLRKIGVSETDFIRECDASFKQGSKFVNWSKGQGEFYYHPFTLPAAYGEFNLSPYWRREGFASFAEAVSHQPSICENNLAPKQAATPEYAFIQNYGYHLDAGKFADFLRAHCLKLGVKHISDEVVRVNGTPSGDIESLLLESGLDIKGDLFVDCTGFSAILFDKHYQIARIDKGDILFNDTALAAPIPYANPNDPIASCTIGTAQDNGWVWDIGLPSRRGVGYVFSSAHTDELHAEETVTKYVAQSLGEKAAKDIMFRKITFSPHFREVFWHKNCVAIGLSAGFIEPLEATALVLVELSAQMLAEEMPQNRRQVDIVADRFNKRFKNHWERTIDFLKLHYVLTQRADSDYWRDHLSKNSIPASLEDSLELWRGRSPWLCDNIYRGEMFPSASFQYVLYGMKPNWEEHSPPRRGGEEHHSLAKRILRDNAGKLDRLLHGLPLNRNLYESILKNTMPKA